MQFMRFFAEKDDQNRRLDRVLRKFLLQHPLPLLYKSIRNGFIRVNDKKTSADYRVQSGDCIAIEQYLYQNGAESKKLQTPTDGVYNALCAPVLQDVFKNEHIRIINKPYGIPVHGAHGCQALDSIVQNDYRLECRTKEKAQALSFTPGPLHRLDRRTTGLLAFSQSLKGAQWFSQALKDKKIKKEYLALLCGALHTSAVWEHRLDVRKKNALHNNNLANEFSANTLSSSSARTSKAFKTVNVMPLEHANTGAYARTEVYPIASAAVSSNVALPNTVQQKPRSSESAHAFSVTFVKIRISTGRTHQIRAQAAFCGFPLLGDTAYGAPAFTFPFGAEQNAQSLFLHAHKLRFPAGNPLGLPSSLSAPLPVFFAQCVQTLLSDVKLLPYTDANETVR